MLNVSSRVHFTALKKMGYVGIIIALDQHAVRVKEKGEERMLCKGWCSMNKRHTLRFILSPPVWFILTKGSWPDMMCSSHLSSEKERMSSKSIL